MKKGKLFSILFFLAIFIQCEYNRISEQKDGENSLKIRISALTTTCSGEENKNPFDEINRLKVIITTPDIKAGTIKKIEKVFSIEGKTEFKVKGVPEGTKNEITLLGYSSSQPDVIKWFARKHNLPVLKERDNPVDLVLTRYGYFTCIKPPTSFTNRIFPSITDLKDGRFLITGGFTRAEVDPQNSQYYRIFQPSDLAMIYNSQQGTLEQLPVKMLQGRGMHESVYLPEVETAQSCSVDTDCPKEFSGVCSKDGLCIKADSGEIIKTSQKKDLVLIFGGASEIKMKIDEISFPFEINKATGFSTYEIFDIKEMKFIDPGKDLQGKPKRMTRNRVFPRIARLSDNTVLITGGGEWPKENDPGYKDVDLWAPYEDNYRGGFMDLKGGLKMRTMRSGHSVTFIGNTSMGLSRYLFYGGTTETNKAEFLIEIYTQSSQQEKGVNGVFKQIKAPSLLPVRYFHTMTKLTGNSFLLAGGVEYNSNTKSLILPTIEKVYILKLKTQEANDIIEVEEINALNSLRFFHSATTPDGINVTIFGGYTDFKGEANGDIRFFNYNKKSFGPPAPPVELLPRGGHSAVVLPDDTILFAGGIKSTETLQSDNQGILEIYTPSNIEIEIGP